MAAAMCAPRLTDSVSPLIGLLLCKEMSVRGGVVTIPDCAARLHLAYANPPSIRPGNALGLTPSPNRALSKRRKTLRLPGASGEKSKRTTSRITVLVVDDVHDVTEVIELFLKHAGYDVATAASARTALQLAGERAFDLVISDIGMPAMNGYELAEALRHLPDYRDTPMIAVTGFTEYDDRGRSLQAGFTAHLTKPIDPSQLLDLMKQLLG